jgi:tripartite-type tricarboxylate transporter receptor subunit TctC
MKKVWFLTVAAAWLVFAPVWAQYADRPIKLIVPTAPGGINDVVARLLQPGLSAALKQPIVIENKSGANNIIGTDYVSKSKPDGYTLVVVPASHSVNPAVNNKMPFDTEKDLAPIILVGKAPMMLVANPAVPANSLQELMGLARQKNNQLSFSSPGNASQTHLVMAQLFDMAGVQAIHVPYRGGSPSLLATLSNETQFTLISSVLAATHLESKKLRALAIGSLNRDPLFPEVPTFAEAGFAGLEAVTWVGLFAPAQTPAPIVALLNKEIDRLIREPLIAGNLQKQGIAISGGSPEVLGKLVTSEISRWTAIARKSSISSAAQ